MKKLILLLSLALSSLLSQSIYPLPFTFDDSNLYISAVDYREEKLISIEFSDVDGDGIVIKLSAYPNNDDCLCL
jgi:hypothetical protein